MSATQFFADRDKLRLCATAAFTNLVDYGAAEDRLNQQHDDLLFAVVSEYDNGCAEDHHIQQEGLFRLHADAAFVLDALRRDHSDDEDYAFYIERVRVY